MFLVLLRMAIGWHFGYEGWSKLHPKKDSPPFSAEGYLRNATGPLAPRFREIIPDADALDRLDPDKLKARWADDLGRIEAHYGLDSDQRAKALASLRESEAKADAWFRDPETIQKVQKYKDQLARLRRFESQPPSLSFERERTDDLKKDVDSSRRELASTVDAWGGALRESWAKLATGDQVKRAGPMPREWTSLDWINLVTIYGLMAVGAGLFLGLFTRLSALGAAAYLAMFYLSMPPWPGLPEGAMQEGHYLVVNKNLIELIACLALASLPTGQWIGLDALLFGWMGRRRAARAEGPDDGDGLAEAEPAGPPRPRARRQSGTR